MKNRPVYIRGAGIISPLGSGLRVTEAKLRENHSAITRLGLFPLLQGSPLPSGQSPHEESSVSLPRTHRLARIAAAEAMEGQGPPDAIILGTTTGGILTTEQLLYSKETNKELYKNHGLYSVADDLARELKCIGPVIVVSTACSSGAVAITLAKRMLLSGKAKTVLAGGVDSLSRLTYFGFNSLQLVDKNGCKPLDINRLGMAVAEGAGMLLLSNEKPHASQMAILGAGLSCDAYHGAAPHPEGQGAYAAMEKALADAELHTQDIDYINLHGTGTPENDLAESKAIRKAFSPLPPLSSIKGATGHTLAAAGAVEAVIATLTVSKNLLPANTNLQEVDPALELSPVMAPCEQPVEKVLSNSFGFGGNNGSLIIGNATTTEKISATTFSNNSILGIHGVSCLTGVGDLTETMLQLNTGKTIAGMAELATISKNLPPRLIRRLKRLPRMTLSLAIDAHENSGNEMAKPHSVFMGTGWGALSETHDFFNRLMETEEQFSSPIDFVGSVHNAPASQVAIMFGCTGANITTSGGDYSFEQAFLATDLMLDDTTEPALILGADEGHKTYSPLFDPSIAPGSDLSDGGGAFYVSKDTAGAKCCLSMPFYRNSLGEDTISSLVESLQQTSKMAKSYSLIMVGIPAAMKDEGEMQLGNFLELSKVAAPIIQYRDVIGEFASASAVATALATSFLKTGNVPEALTKGEKVLINTEHDAILILGLGKCISAMELFTP